ncbi:hypothetical protein [Streptomyces sp. HUAS TT7]|uniref:hypothetical protein n=1 Tax=Streptomyces sp. HUAS TT7 TaxID=3447507 RepID=UPI003F65C91B
MTQAEGPRPDQPVSEHSVPDPSMPDRSVPEQRGSEQQGSDQVVREAAPSASAEADTVLPSEERDKLQLRIQHTVGGFVDEPRSAVEEAASAVDVLAERITETLGRRRGKLRASWQDASGGAATEDLRLALCEYRRLAERLLSL